MKHISGVSKGGSGGSRISKRGVLIYCCARSAREFLEATPTFGQNHAHFQSFLRQSTSSFSPIDLFSNEFLLKHSKVSHNSSFLSSVARKGGSIFLSSVYFLVLGVAKRGVPVHPWIPLWIRHWGGGGGGGGAPGARVSPSPLAQQPDQ